MGQNEAPPEKGRSRIAATLVLIVLILVVGVVGYLIIDTLMKIRRPIDEAARIPQAVATEVQEIINPTPTIIADPVTIVRQMQDLSRLETAAFTIEKVITAESGEGALGFLFQDRLLLVAQGQVIAGIDLARMTEEDIQVAGDSVFVTMPAAEIFVATLNNENTYVYDRETAILGQQVDLETLARQEAEAAILEAAIEEGILRMAQDNAEHYLVGLMKALGFNEVVFVKGTPGPDQNQGEWPVEP
jgi:hypothetical protein